MKKTDDESAVLSKIAEMPEEYSAIGEEIHALIRKITPVFTPRVWYGMPAYAKDGKVICFFRGSETERYMTLGFTEDANLDEGQMWPTAFAIKELTTTVKETITALVKKSVS